MKRLSALFIVTLLVRLASANTYNVTGTADGPGSISGGPSTFNATTLRAAVNAANSVAGPHTINLPAGTYNTTNELPVGTGGGLTVTVSGAGSATTIVQHDLTSPVARVFDLDPNLLGNVNVTLQNITIAHGRNNDGIGGAGIISGFQTPPDATTISNCVLLDNQSIGVLSGAVGGGIQNIGGTLIVNNSTFASNSAGIFNGGGIYYDSHSPSVGTLSISGCTFTANSSGSTNSGGGGIYLTAVSGSSLSISNSAFFGNQATGGGAGGGAIYKDGTAALAITRCNFVTNQVLGTSPAVNASSGGAVNVNSGSATLQYCRFFGNTTAAGNKGSALFNASGNGASAVADNNWWASNTGPGAGVFTSGSGNGALGSWLQLRHYATPGSVAQNGVTTLTASFLTNSAGAAISTSNLGLLIGLPITFNNAVKGTISSPQAVIQASGTATATFTAGAVPGAASADATVDGAVATASISILCPASSASVSGNTNICAGTAAIATVVFGGGIPPYTVTLNNGGGTRVGNSPLSFTNFPVTTTIYSISSATDSNGCPATTSGSATATVNPAPATPAIFTSPASTCSGSSGNLATSVNSANAYSWTISNGTITSATNLQTITYTLGGPGVVTLNLTVFNASGCSASASTNTAVTAALVTVVNINDNGPGSLRQALLDVCPGGNILFAPGLTNQTIRLTGGELSLNKNLSISGPGADKLTVSGNHVSRVFFVAPGITSTIAGLTIAEGVASGTVDPTFGGGIYNSGDLTLLSCVVRSNSAPDVNNGWGGGIYSTNVLRVAACTIGPGNTAGLVGGGIYAHFNSILQMLNSTVSSNSCLFQVGGVVANTGGMVTLTNCTITGNSDSELGGGYVSAGNFSQLMNTIIAGNTSSGGSVPDIYTFGVAVVSLGHNLIGVTNTTTGWLATDLTGNTNTPLNARLGPLANNGGPTPTHALLTSPKSPAIDAGSNIGATPFDQRGPGFPRIAQGTNDIGALETQLRPTLINARRLAGGGFQFNFITTSNAVFTADFTTNLTAPAVWTALGLVAESPPGSGQFQFTDSAVTTNKQRFYRVHIP